MVALDVYKDGEVVEALKSSSKVITGNILKAEAVLQHTRWRETIGLQNASSNIAGFNW